jgi:hypothetical protein
VRRKTLQMYYIADIAGAMTKLRPLNSLSYTVSVFWKSSVKYAGFEVLTAVTIQSTYTIF